MNPRRSQIVTASRSFDGAGAVARGPLHWIILGGSLLLQVLSCLGKQDVVTVRGGINWESQYYWLVAVSFSLTLYSYVLPASWKPNSALLIRFVACVVVFLPTGVSLGLRQMFVTALVMDVAHLLPHPRNVGLSVAALVAVALFSALSRRFTQGTPLRTVFGSLPDLAYSLFIAVVVSHVRQSTDRLRRSESRTDNLLRTINKLTDANTGFQHYIKIVEAKSTEDERNRIIRELHDSLGYAMTSIIMLSESSMKLAEQGEHGGLMELLRHIRDASKTGLTDIRIALRIMKPKKASTVSMARRLGELVEAFQRATNVRIDLEYNQISASMDTDHFHIVFRFIQEGMINSFRHGAATSIRVTVFQEADQNLIVTIMDNGTGFQELSVGLGLKGIEERLAQVGGEFSISSTPWGVRLRASVPLVPPKVRS